MIEIRMTFPSFAAAAVALAKLNEGDKLLKEYEAGTALATGTVEVTADKAAETTDTADAGKGPKKGRRTNAQIAADEAAKKTPPADTSIGGEPEKTAEPAKVAEIVDEDPFGIGGGTDTAAPTFDTRLADWLKANDGKTALDFMRSQLQRILDKKGMDGTRAFMAKFGHPRITDAPAEKYPALLDLIDKEAA